MQNHEGILQTEQNLSEVRLANNYNCKAITHAQSENQYLMSHLFQVYKGLRRCAEIRLYPSISKVSQMYSICLIKKE